MPVIEFIVLSASQVTTAEGLDGGGAGISPRAIDGVNPGTGSNTNSQAGVIGASVSLAGKFVAPKRIVDDADYQRACPNLVSFLLALPFCSLDTDVIFAPSAYWGAGDAVNVSSLTDGCQSIFSEPFSTLRLRTGGYASGQTTGYSDPASTGIWAFNGENWMTSPASAGNSSDSRSSLVNGNYNWQPVDPSFQGLVSVTPDGLVLEATGAYSAIRNSLPLLPSGDVPYLGSLLSTAPSVRITPPFVCRVEFTLDTMGVDDFPCIFLLNEHYAVSIANPDFRHREVDMVERFGYLAASRISSGIRTDPGTGQLVSSGGDYDTGAPVGPGILNKAETFVSDGLVLTKFNGVLRQALYPPAGTATANDRFHIVLGNRIGMSWQPYPASAPDAKMTVRSVEFLRPFTLANDLIP